MAFRCFFSPSPKKMLFGTHKSLCWSFLLKKHRLVKDVFCSYPWPFFHIRAPENPVFFMSFCYFLPGSRCHYLSKWWFPRFGWWLTLRKKNMVKLINHRKPSYSKMVGQGFSEVEQLSPEKWWHLKEAIRLLNFGWYILRRGELLNFDPCSIHSMISVDWWHAAPVTHFFFVAKRLNRDEQLMRDTSGQSERPLWGDFFWRDP